MSTGVRLMMYELGTDLPWVTSHSHITRRQVLIRGHKNDQKTEAARKNQKFLKETFARNVTRKSSKHSKRN